MTSRGQSIDVPEEPDVDPPEDEQPNAAISFFTAARQAKQFIFLNYFSLLKDCPLDGKGLWICRQGWSWQYNVSKFIKFDSHKQTQF